MSRSREHRLYFHCCGAENAHFSRELTNVFDLRVTSCVEEEEKVEMRN